MRKPALLVAAVLCLTTSIACATVPAATQSAPFADPLLAPTLSDAMAVTPPPPATRAPVVAQAEPLRQRVDLEDLRWPRPRPTPDPVERPTPRPDAAR